MHVFRRSRWRFHSPPKMLAGARCEPEVRYVRVGHADGHRRATRPLSLFAALRTVKLKAPTVSEYTYIDNTYGARRAQIPTYSTPKSFVNSIFERRAKANRIFRRDSILLENFVGKIRNFFAPNARRRFHEANSNLFWSNSLRAIVKPGGGGGQASRNFRSKIAAPAYETDVAFGSPFHLDQLVRSSVVAISVNHARAFARPCRRCIGGTNGYGYTVYIR